MLFNILSVLVLAALVALFAWLASAAWRSRRGWVRWPGLVIAGLLALVFLAASTAAALGFYRLSNAPHRYTVSDVKVAMTPAQIARGEKLALICVDCHSSSGSLPLDGSKENFLEEMPVGTMYASNLTPGGPLKNWSDGEIIRALREGVDKEGRPLVIMPSSAFHAFSDEDAQAITAFLRSQPAVNRDLPKRDLNVIAALFVGAGLFPTSAQTPIAQPVVAPPIGTADHGKYLVDALACRDCHGQNLDGVITGPGPGGGPNLIQAIPQWSQAQFKTFFRTGTLPEGRTVDPEAMPWKSYGQIFSDEDMTDIYQYLKNLEGSAQ